MATATDEISGQSVSIPNFGEVFIDKDDRGSSGLPEQIFIRTPDGPIPVVYGERRIGGEKIRKLED